MEVTSPSVEVTGSGTKGSYEDSSWRSDLAFTSASYVSEPVDDAARGLLYQGSRADVISWMCSAGSGEQMRAISSATSNEKRMLIDGGATNALRGPAVPGEHSRYERVSVGLAVGQAQLAQTPAGILTADSEAEPLMPTQYLIALGFQMKWTGKGCVIFRGGSTLPVALQNGCPTIPLDLGLKLLEELSLIHI